MTPISIVGANQIFVHKTCLYVMIVVSLSLSLIISHALLPMLIVKLLTEQNQVSASGWSSDYILSLCLLLHAFSFWQINWSELTFRQRCTANLSVKASPVSEMLTSISPENPENYYSRWPAGTRCFTAPCTYFTHDDDDYFLTLSQWRGMIASLCHSHLCVDLSVSLVLYSCVCE